MNKQLSRFIPTTVMLPAILIGVLAMHASGVSAALYLQNFACFVVLSAASFFLLARKNCLFEAKPLPFIAACLLALGCTFLQPDVEGVRRWVSLGPISLYVAAIVLPILLIALKSLLTKGKRTLPAACALCAALLLSLQPDASMTTAFAAASILLFSNELRALPRALFSALLIALSALTWVFLDALAPVSYVEGIFGLVCGMGALFAVLGAASLLFLALPFLVFPPKGNRMLALSFGVYWIAILASAAFGSFPLPLMGFGVSPIIGYFISILWLSGAYRADN